MKRAWHDQLLLAEVRHDLERPSVAEPTHQDDLFDRALAVEEAEDVELVGFEACRTL
jgi:hypothetical protein